MAFDINNRGQIVFLGNLSDESFLYSNGTYTTLDMFAYGLNDRGQIVGYGPLPPPSVPLPTALPLFATGLAGLGLLGWRRKKKTAAG